ncbi:AraC family transcriptional regulator [Deinococcus radiotolerans]|uniref:AraC family transcriptional regulator n=1 Tax=Deinococcus radiotolerans TaxID=1309407 RepID=A0ABQ2FQS7_9DEIO|nr:AraC family transcriptional regulator [Deinococcus radiotolerans]GGL17703.1 AraC family transcriptional regulator [Deinococcus radiotolerans]
MTGVSDLAAGGLARLAELIQRHTPYEGECALRVPGVSVARTVRPHKALAHSVQKPALCLVAQGNKAVHIGAEQYAYDPQRMMVYAVHVPVAFQVTRASVEEPFLTFKLELDPERIAELALKLYPHGLPRRPEGRGVQVTEADPAILNAAIRVLETVDQEREATWIGPLIVDEMVMRLLLGPVGPMVAQMGQVESSTQRIERAIGWIQAHFEGPLNVEALAELSHMGVSTFHAHFKAVTGLSPLQFQKNLRLQEARRLMYTTGLDVGAVSRQVGYASASQFTREYTRLFSSTPRQDMTELRLGGAEGR